MNANSFKMSTVARIVVLSLLLALLQLFTQSNQAYGAGVGSISFIRTGTGSTPTNNQYLSIPARANYKFDGDFTIEAWVRFNTLDSFQAFLGQYVGGGWSLQMNNNKLRFSGNLGASYREIDSSKVFVTGTWYHIAFERYGTNANNIAIYVDGVLTGNADVGADVRNNSLGNPLQINTVGGGTAAGGNDRFNGNITNIRYVNGTAVYKGPFTPSLTPLTAIPGTVLLLSTNNENFTTDSSPIAAKITTYNGASTTDGVPLASALSPFPKATPTFTWANVTKNMGDTPYVLTAPTPSTPGTFTYSSATPGVIALDNVNTENATVAGIGTSIITASFIPTDSDSYSSATTTMTVTVNKMLQSAVSVSLSPTTKVIKSGFSQVLTTLSGSGGSGTGAFNYTVSTVTSGANCALANNAGTYTLSAATAGTCTLTATRASDASYQSASASTNFTFSTPVRTLSFATTAYSLPYLATQQLTATASAQDGLAPITFSGNSNTNTNPKLLLGAQSGAGNFFGYAASLGAYTIGQTVTFTDQRAGSTVAYTGTFNAQSAGGFGYAFYLNNISQITGTSINSTSTQWILSGNGAITYSAGVSTACSVSANTGLVSITASTGTCSITASMPEDATYLASSTVTPVAITVGKAAQTPIVLTVSPTSKNGIAPFTQQLVTLSATGGTGTGVLAYSIADVTAGATCQLTENAGVYTVTAATAGTCSITATKPADTNYLVSADSKTFSFNSNRTLTYAAGLGGGVKSGVTAPTAGPFLTGDTFAIATGSAYERAGFSFTGWSDGTNTFAAGDNYTVASANITLTAQWRQTSLFGILDADLEEMQSWNASNRTNSGTISNTAGTSSVTVTVPANALTSGTTVKLWELKNSDFAKSKVDPSKDYIVNLVLSWLKDNGVGQAQTVPTASTPITLSISNSTIKKGAIAYQIIGDVVTQIGTATADGVLNLSITEDPVISIANPIVEAPNNGGGGGGGGAPVVIIEKTPEVVKPIEVEKPVDVVPVLAKSVQVTHKVFFGMNAAWINSANIKSLKSFIAKISASNQLSQITIEGFTQPTPINPNPLILSKARANSVAKLIRSQGVKAKIVKAGKGDEKVNDPSSRYVLVTVTTSVAG
jgi:uncharacterized repeat protein (TIGR02543 family)